ncbi:MAG: 4-hydroxy-tetrahydrodipicolinate reductase [Propioniciclava sp.]
MKVAVFGAKGRMGAEVVRAVTGADDLELVAGIDLGEDRTPALQADVVVDFTVPDAVMENLAWCAGHDIHAVVGTTGFTPERLDEVRSLLAGSRANAIVAANFSIGGLLMMHWAEQAARFYDSVEVIELHHPHKVDAPSGTAATTARRIAAARDDARLGPVPDATTQDEGARGAIIDGIHVHGVRMQGLFANQQVIFGNEGEGVTITHNSYTRASYMPGILAAIRAVPDHSGLTVGIEGLLGIR